MRMDELLEYFTPELIDEMKDEINASPGMVPVVHPSATDFKMQLWSRRFIGPFTTHPDSEFFPGQEVHVFYTSPEGRIKIEVDEDGYIKEDVIIYGDDGNPVLVPAGTPFGADPKEEPVLIVGVMSTEPGDDGYEVVRCATAGISWRQLKLLEAAALADTEPPKPKVLFERVGIFLDPIRAAAFVLNCRGHFTFIDDVGTGKSKLIAALSTERVVGRGGTEAAITWNARDKAPGIVLRQPGGFIGWDEIDKARPSEIRSLLMDVLDFKVSRKVAGFLTETEHFCRFIIAGNRLPSLGEGGLHAFVSRLQYLGGVAGEAREKVAFDVSSEATEAIRFEVADAFARVHVAEYAGDPEEFTEVSNEVYREVVEKYRNEIAKALTKAIYKTARMYPPEEGVEVESAEELLERLLESGGSDKAEIDDEFAKTCAYGHLHDKIRRFSDTLAALGVEEAAEVAREAFSLTEVEPDVNDEDDVGICVEAWKVALENNYGELVVDGDSPGPKVSYAPIWEPDDVRVTWDDVLD